MRGRENRATTIGRYVGSGAPQSSLPNGLPAGGFYDFGDIYVDAVGKVVWDCVTAGSRSASVWIERGLVISIYSPDGSITVTTPTGVVGLSVSSLAGAVPTGAQILYSNSTPPSGYLACDGSAVSRSTYAALFAVIGTDYGSGNGSTTFNVPNKVGQGDVVSGTQVAWWYIKY